MRDYRQRERYAIFIRLNEWVIFIKESRNWHASKYHWINNYLIDNHDTDEDVVVAIINLLRHLSDDSMRKLLAFRVSIWCHVHEIIDDSIDDKEEIMEIIEAISLLWMNLVIIDSLYQLDMRITMIRNLIVRL